VPERERTTLILACDAAHGADDARSDSRKVIGESRCSSACRVFASASPCHIGPCHIGQRLQLRFATFG
jgi:hypothetical protein